VAVRLAAAGVLLAALFFSSSASAQRSKFDGLRQCERHAAAQFRKTNPQFRRFVIDRASASEDKYAAPIGLQFVSTIYHGKAMLDNGNGEKAMRFICLHAGYKRGPLFVYTMAE
jgi:hypothetical protein